MSIQDLWSDLERDARTIRTGYMTRRIRPESTHDIYLAIGKPEDTCLLMIRMRRESIMSEVVFPASRGFVVKKVIMPGDDDQHVTLHLVLTDRRYADIFTTLVEDIVDHIADIAEEKAAVATFISRLQQWQAFLRKDNPHILGEEAQRGLFGELHFLRRYAIPLLGTSEALGYWVGPRSAVQDFQFKGFAVEVKTSVSKRHQKIQIASERQLDENFAGLLYIYHLSLDARQEGGETLPQMVTSIRDIVKVNLPAAENFEQLLLEAGYLDLHASNYDKTGYVTREISFFKVEGLFPRILENELRNGVGDVHYSISVAECRHYSVNESEVTDMMKGIGDA